MQVFKFGGASVKDASAVRNLKAIVKKHASSQLVVVISAMGKGTNLLEVLLAKAIDRRNYEDELEEFISFHSDISNELLGQECDACQRLIEQLSFELTSIRGMQWVEAYDRIAPYGELISTCIIGDFLKTELPIHWMDARQFIKTDEFHTEANVLWELTEECVRAEVLPILKNEIVITQGFIGSTENNITTTLGREGSDYSGAILAHCLHAEKFTVWKDVTGVLNGDPKVRPGAIQFNQLSYREATEMTYYGAKVIHPKTLKPLAQRNIPLIVRSFNDHQNEGTKITKDASIKELPVFIFKENQLLFSLEVKDHSFIDEKSLSIILNILQHLNVKINLMQNSASTFSFCMDNKLHKLDPIVEALSEYFDVSYNRPLKLSTIKNYTEESLNELPEMSEILLLQKTRHTYQALYR